MATVTVHTVVPSPTEDAEQLHKAFEGWGTNEDLIISILAHRNAAQRRSIRQAYADAYGEDLLKDLDKELSSDFERCVLLWTLDPPERDVYLANEATKRFTSSNLILMEVFWVFCTRSSLKLFAIRQAYHAQYKKSLEFPQATAQLNATLNRYNDGSATPSTRYNVIFHLVPLRRHPVNQDLKADPNDEYLNLVRATIKCLTIPEKHSEKVLRHAIIKLGTDEWALTRVVVTRSEIDMVRIKEQFHKRNSTPLDSAIADDTSGDYRKILLALVGKEDA